MSMSGVMLMEAAGAGARRLIMDCWTPADPALFPQSAKSQDRSFTNGPFHAIDLDGPIIKAGAKMIQLEFLMNEFEEESTDDTDYYLNTVTLEMLAERPVDPELLGLLRQGLGDRQEMEIEWVRI